MKAISIDSLHNLFFGYIFPTYYCHLSDADLHKAEFISEGIVIQNM